MNKKFIIALILLSTAGFLKAQDSVRYKLSEMFQQEHNYYLRRVITQPLLPMQQYAVVEASYKNTKSDFISRQDAPRQNEISFFTEGTKKVKKFLVSGSFSYQRIMKDSVGYTLTNNEQNAPYYLYAAAKGNWELSRYNLQGIMSTPLNKKMTASVGAAYRAGNSWRSNDPRVEDFLLNTEIEGGLHYKINEKNTVGATFGYSSFATENSIEYRNLNVRSNPLQYPEYLTRLNYGNGFSLDFSSGQQMYTYNTGHNVNAIYQGQFDFGTVTLTSGFKSTNSRFEKKPISTSTSKIRYGKFYEEIYSSDMIWKSRKKGPEVWSVTASYTDHYGRDFNDTLKANNFISYNTQFSIKPMFGYFKNNQLKYEIALNGNISRLYTADGTTKHVVDYKNADMGIIAAYYFSGKKAGNFFKLSAGVNFRMNINSVVSVPESQETNYSREVVYYNYYFNSANSTSFTFGALYNFSVKKLPLFIKSTYQIQNAKLPEITLPATAFPGTERHFGSFALGFTL